jgi:serine/threonine protein kinase
VRSLQRLARSGQLDYHGDLKPENLIVKPSGSVIMIDPAMRCDERNVITTTPHYNPLLLRDSKADVMAIGVMLYEILTGVLPFDEVPWQYAGREQGGEVERMSLSYFLSYPPPRDLNPNTPEPLAKIVYRALTVPEYGLPELERDLVDFLRKE